MIDGYKEKDFMSALKDWDNGKRVKCIYRQNLFDFTDTENEWRTDFKVDAGMILEGKWFVEEDIKHIGSYLEQDNNYYLCSYINNRTQAYIDVNAMNEPTLFDVHCDSEGSFILDNGQKIYLKTRVEQ